MYSFFKAAHLFFFFCLFSFAPSLIAQQSPNQWTVKKPFEHRVFIQNEGQWNSSSVPGNPEILFGLANHEVQIFFTPGGLVYYYDEVIGKNRGGEEEEEEESQEEKKRRMANKKPPVHIPHFVTMHFENANANIKVIGEEPESYYFTYSSKTAARGFKAQAFKKIIYQNIYPSIDLEFTFPSDTTGIKYAFILHPGADASMISMKYSGASLSKTGSGNINISSPAFSLTDHAPVSFYKDQASQTVASSFELNNETVTFRMGAYDKSKTLIIDPWVNTPGFSYNAAYDVDFDNAGNVYAYGGKYPYELIKLNQFGGMQWVHVTSVFSPWTYYGDFAVDPQSGSVYVVECWNYAAQILKLDQAGMQSGLFAGNTAFQEIYRVLFNPCTNKIIMAGGAYGTNTAVIDTTFTTINLVNILNTTEVGHDMVLLEQDLSGNCFMATSALGQNFNNVLIKCPAATLSPVSYMVPDNHTFQESGSVDYINGTLTRAGFNGITATSAFVYTYDGKLIQRFSKSNGNLLASANISSNTFSWGGIDADDCGRVYAGVGSNIYQYDTSFAQPLYIASASGPVYDLKISRSNTLYACGFEFIMKRELESSVCNPVILSSASFPCLTTGSATVTAAGGAGPYTYSWNPSGQTGSSVSGLAGGTYTVTVKDASCIPYTNTVSVFIGSSSGSIASVNAPDTVCSGSSAMLVAAGGTSYQWSTGDTSKIIFVNPLVTSTYSVIVSAGTDCIDTAEVTVAAIPWPQAEISGDDTVCSSYPTILSAGGGGTYKWNTGEKTETISVTVNETSSYWVAVSNGYCTDTAEYTVTVKSSPVAAASVSMSDDFSATLSATGGVTYNWYPPEGLSCVDCPTPVVTVDRPVTYCVSVADNQGCLDTACVTVLFSAVYIPDAFTPDGDILNEVFRPVVTEVHAYRFAVFNKWGEKIFDTTDTEAGWNGCYKGRPCQMDVYVYKVWYTDNQYNEEHIRIGKVTLLR